MNRPRRSAPLRQVSDSIEAFRKMMVHHDDHQPVGFVIAVRYNDNSTITLSNGDTHGLMNVVRDALTEGRRGG